MADVTLVRRQLNAVITNGNREMAKGADLLRADPRDSLDITASVAKLNSYQTRVFEYIETILGTLTDGDVIDSEIAKFEAVKDSLMEAIAKMSLVLQLIERGEGRSVNHEDEDATSNGGERASSWGVSVKLPKLQMGKFSGDPMKFQEFWDTFDTTIHQNTKLAPVEKFKYLRSYLDGSALVLAEGYSLTAANYESVIEVLKERFGDPELAIFCHLDALLAVPMAGSRAPELQKVYDDCECHIRSLVGLGLPESTFGRVFVRILLSKLPTQVRVTLHQKKGSGVCWKLSELREMIRTEIYARQMGGRAFGNKKESEDSSPKGRAEYGKYSRGRTGPFSPPTASSLATSTQGRSQNIRCNFCGLGHYSDQCRNYAELDTRRKALGDACFICLRQGHSAAKCRSKKPCFFCQRDTHHRSLCPKRFGRDMKQPVAPSSDNNVASGSAAISEANATIVTRGKRGILQTALAEVTGISSTVRSRLLLDIGSDNTFATNSVLKKLGARQTGTDIVGLAGFQATKRSATSSPVHEISIALKSGKQLKLDVYGTDVITCPIEKHGLDTHRNPILQLLPLAEPLSETSTPVEIIILIGSDYYYDIVKTERIPLDGGLLLLDSELGYILAGRTPSDASNGTSMVASLACPPLPDSNFDLERFWKLEEIGVKDPPETCDDERALAMFNTSVQFDESERRYQVKWPWKEESPELPSNFQLSFGRLKSLTKRIQENGQLLEKYQNTIEDQLTKQVIEEVPDTPDGTIVHYIPHHGVVTPQKATTKLRIVYDASCRLNRQSQSLNDCMYRGPVMLHDLCGLLLRFRLTPVGIISDLEKAFLQIGLQSEDRDAARFLWLRDPHLPCTLDNLLKYRFRRVCFGVVASPFLLAATVSHLLKAEGTPVAKQIADNIYVDNIVGGSSGTAEALLYYKEAKNIFMKASMNLREFFSNDSEFMAQIPARDRGMGSTTKVVGITWDTHRDTLSVPVGNPVNGGVEGITKRKILRHIAQIFDPCGFFAPITSVGKMLMQELWQNKYGWDETLPDIIVKRWTDFLSSYRHIPNFRIARHLGVSTSLKADRVGLHCFCDASAKAYCSVAYLRIAFDCKFKVDLLFAKSRVSPLKKQSIPRLELLAILIGVKMVDFLEGQLHLPISEKIIWSDSQCALHWVINTSVSTTFVRNRVNKIRESKGIDFRYVPSEDNPADIPTRGQSFAELRICQQWWHGPSWLQQAQTEWPRMPIASPELNSSNVALALVATPSTVSVFDASRASVLDKLILTAVYVLRFIDQAHKRTRKALIHPSLEEVERAKLCLVKEAQSRHFASIFDSDAKSNKDLVLQLGLFADSENIIRCLGRIQHADLPTASKWPILLSKHDPFTTLVVLDCHNRLHHAGVKHTLAELRYQFWVAKGRSEVKRILSDCHTCRWLRGGPFRAPPEHPLPDHRVRCQRPFTCVGLDYMGPLLIYPTPGEMQKTWICLYTCAATRAVHLEVVTTMSAEDFLLSFRRFIAAHGCPEIIISDNAKTLVVSDKAIQKLWRELLQTETVIRFSALKGVKWKFIVEMAPWMGGLYERMVGIVKNSLKSVLNRKRLTLVQLQTVVAEAATIVNSRPLIYSENEIGDFPLTPAHLTMRHHSLLLLPHSDSDVDHIEKPNAVDCLIQGWKRGQMMLAQFWESWKHNYLVSLRERAHQKSRRNVVSATPWLGMLVLLAEKNLPRGRWQIGRVVELIHSGDEVVRSAVVKTSEGKLLRRPIRLLYPLETTRYLHSSDQSGRSVPEAGGFGCSEIAQIQPPSDGAGSRMRSTRQAAVDARIRIRDNIQSQDDSSE